ncbi:MAG: MarR family transcriptional regulator [Lachnospiraceae bacterium]|nr:MarR family transcriptional regulator [Lachnospiraceae bacterium]
MSKNYDCLKLENQLCFPLYACAKEVTRRYKPFLDRLDLTYTQYITMMVLWEEKRINVKEIGKRLYLDSGTLTPLLKKLEAKGYITRHRSEEDERNLLVTITKEGEALREEAKKIPSEMGRCLKLSEEETKLAYEILYKMLDELKQENDI